MNQRNKGFVFLFLVISSSFAEINETQKLANEAFNGSTKDVVSKIATGESNTNSTKEPILDELLNTGNESSILNVYTISGTVAGAVILTPLMIALVPGCFGFTAGGIKAGSAAAFWMSSTARQSGGGVESGSFVSTCQAIGALGICGALCIVPTTAMFVLGLVPFLLTVCVGAAIGFGCGYGVRLAIVEHLGKNEFGLVSSVVAISFNTFKNFSTSTLNEIDADVNGTDYDNQTYFVNNSSYQLRNRNLNGTRLPKEWLFNRSNKTPNLSSSSDKNLYPNSTANTTTPLKHEETEQSRSFFETVRDFFG